MNTRNARRLPRTFFFLFTLIWLSLSCRQEQPKQSLQINDYFGRSVSLSAPAERIIPTYYVEAEILCALGMKSKIVGIGFIHNDSKSPQSYILNKFMPETYLLPQIGRGKDINIERVIGLKPDLIICENQQENIRNLEDLGFTTIALFPRRLADVFAEIRALGHLTGADDRSRKLEGHLRQAVEKVRQRTDGFPDEKLRKLYYVRSDLLTTVNDPGHNEIFRICGGKNVADVDFSPYSVTISLENLLQWNPATIIIRDRSPLTPADILQDSRLSDLDAVKNNQVFKEHSGWIEFRMEAVFGIIEKAKWLHPDIFRDLDASEEFEDFENLIREFNE
ncbi:MAG: ABC transporter substrate-binding protein [Chloracidobacterium sp.]|nr:ABC transporter substrate-binding protein [Chloracidobacterium sp.]